jgi:hypothetical protein
LRLERIRSPSNSVEVFLFKLAEPDKMWDCQSTDYSRHSPMALAERFKSRFLKMKAKRESHPKYTMVALRRRLQGVSQSRIALPTAAVLLLCCWQTSRGPVQNVHAAETASCVPAPIGLVSWWAGDGNAKDLQSANDGSTIGSVSFAVGNVGQAFSFDGKQGLVVADVNVTPVDDWAISAWVWWKGLTGATGKQAQTIFAHGNGDRNGYVLSVAESGWCQTFPNLCPHIGELIVVYGGTTWIYPNIRLDEGAWNHVALTRTGGILKVYKNGETVFAQTTQDPRPPSSNFIISEGSPFTFNGLIDEVCFFAPGISDDAVRAMFDAGSSGMCKAPAFTKIAHSGGAPIQFEVKGQTGKNVTVLVSTNAIDWTPWVTLPNAAGFLQFADPANPALNQRLYRLVQ